MGCGGGREVCEVESYVGCGGDAGGTEDRSWMGLWVHGLSE